MSFLRQTVTPSEWSQVRDSRSPGSESRAEKKAIIAKFDVAGKMTLPLASGRFVMDKAFGIPGVWLQDGLRDSRSTADALHIQGSSGQRHVSFGRSLHGKSQSSCPSWLDHLYGSSRSAESIELVETRCRPYPDDDSVVRSLSGKLDLHKQVDALAHWTTILLVIALFHGTPQPYSK
ncbi:hypothetical protein N7532_008644 [Penicillium argentinense]|uniref:Uncharacterized protein n=1 Tax=Penicillium argentinense TaxID=1131581 RepID=A0A9W9EY50_9EURO|nr:uncharacterized protein N7532_008644 [Penicillium argentinense]KAJ5089960.1 hypothetical protein N7532_008644 [Penicillium argentinense]